jgi:formate-dependent phosphoribosylglycinamide formyltransferase (GAR transformylase)
MQLGIPVPRVYSAEGIEFEWPVIVKPVDAFSGRGVTRLDIGDASELAAAVMKARAASPSQKAIVEQFVEGQLYSHSAFLQNGRVAKDFIVIEYGTANPFAVDTSWVTTSFPAAVLARIRNDVALLAGALGLRNGLFHTQFIVRGDCYWFIEVTRRCPGDLYALLIEFSTGFPYGYAYAAPFIGELLPPYRPSESRSILRHTVSALLEGVFGGLRFEDSTSVRLFVPLAAAGEPLGVGPAGRVGVLFLDANSDSELLSLAKRTLDRNLYTIL